MGSDSDDIRVRDNVEYDPVTHDYIIPEVLDEYEEGAEWDREEMGEALRDVGGGVSLAKASKDCESFSKKTLSRMWHRVMDEVQEQHGVDIHEESVFEDPAEQAAEAFREFMEDEMVEQNGFDFSDRVINMIVSEIADSGELPQPQYLVSFIDSAKGTTSNTQELNFIHRRYSKWLSAFYRDNPAGRQGAVTTGNPMAGIQGGRSNGGFGGGMGGQPQMGGSGAGFGQNGGMGQQGFAPGQGGGQQPAMMQMFQQMMEQQREQNEKMMKRIERMEQQQNGDSGDGGMDELDRLIQLQDKLDTLTGGNGSGEDSQQVKQLRREIQQIKQVLSEGGGDGSQDPMQQAMLSFATRDDIDADELASIMSAFGVDTDPDVAAKRIEKQMKEKELEHEKDRATSLVSGMQEVVQNGIETYMQQKQAQQQAQQAQGHRQPQHQGQTPQQAQQQPDAQQQHQQHHQPAEQEWQPPQGQGQGQAYQTDGTGGTMDFDFPDDGMGGADATADAPRQAEVVEDPEPQFEDWECPECGETTEVDTATPGRDCEACGFAIAPCPFCSMPVDVPPEGETDVKACPECSTPVPNLDEEGECPGCGWEGNPSETDTPEGQFCEECDEIVWVGEREEAG